MGRWALSRAKTQEENSRKYSRHEAKVRIERLFDEAVLEILNPIELGDFRVVVLQGDDALPPALSIVCDSVGQLDLGWIEVDNVLSNTLDHPVAPVRWQAAAYHALVDTLRCVLPVFSYVDLFDEVAMYYWDGETTDEGARRSLIEYHGADPEDLDEMTLPSEMNARRPAWMLSENAAPMSKLPPGLRERIQKLRDASKAVKHEVVEGNAWHFDLDLIRNYVFEFEDCSHLPPMTLVPFEHFARELDLVAQQGMEMGFMDIMGLCQLTDAGKVDDWFASLQRGADFLLAAQDLINFDPFAS